jgi:hypothetical protein
MMKNYSEEDQELSSRIREELCYGCVGAATELLEQISSQALRDEMHTVIREYEFV